MFHVKIDGASALRVSRKEIDSISVDYLWRRASDFYAHKHSEWAAREKMLEKGQIFKSLIKKSTTINFASSDAGDVC